ncbi:MAG: alcohol dehydrogenase catalytic domain-containing protein [Deltaproteobacteria bacterium]|nr:alcohol dehydrogenase catalytic domain-containing protein [Deltaproteobacteria bacterium]
MKALLWNKDNGSFVFSDFPEPHITEPDEVKARVISVGVCGTDREVFAQKGYLPPEGRHDLIIGHESLAEVVEVGADVKGLRTGDYVTFTVRRGCDRCIPCRTGRPDMCATGGYKERGLDYMDGFSSEFVVDSQINCIKVPVELRNLGVLCEPLSAIEKALQEIERAQERLPESITEVNWFQGRRCLILGLGTIGLLASVALTLRGASVYGLDIVDESSSRPVWFKGIGGQYINEKKTRLENLTGLAGGNFGLIFQAAGVPDISLELLKTLGSNGAFVFFSAGGKGNISVAGGELIRNIIDNNQTIIGAVSSSRAHFELAVRDLQASQLRWGRHMDGLITHCYHPSELGEVIKTHPPDEIKAVIDWSALRS